MSQENCSYMLGKPLATTADLACAEQTTWLSHNHKQPPEVKPKQST